jgi:DNA-binding NarL/FixJ family response regulator
VTAIPPLLRAELDRFAARHRLTNREHDVLFLLVTGVGTVPDIAGRLELSQNTVHNHFKNMFRRTATNTKSALIGLFVKEAMERQVAAEAFLRRPRVLVLDPDPLERERIAAVLSGHGMYAQVEADSTRVADRIATARVDIIVADLGLPGASGRGVLDDVRSRFGCHPVVLLTTQQRDASRSEWRARGAGELIEKPWDSDRLVFAVMEHFADSPYERSRLLHTVGKQLAEFGDQLEESDKAPIQENLDALKKLLGSDASSPEDLKAATSKLLESSYKIGEIISANAQAEAASESGEEASSNDEVVEAEVVEDEEA